MTPIEEIFCEVDDFCKVFFPEFENGLIPAPGARRRRALSMSASEIMTILILFHLSHYRDFKNFYLDCINRQMGSYFPKRLSCNRFVEVQARVFSALCCYMMVKTGEETGFYYVVQRLQVTSGDQSSRRTDGLLPDTDSTNDRQPVPKPLKNTQRVSRW